MTFCPSSSTSGHKLLPFSRGGRPLPPLWYLAEAAVQEEERRQAAAQGEAQEAEEAARGVQEDQEKACETQGGACGPFIVDLRGLRARSTSSSRNDRRSRSRSRSPQRRRLL